MAKGERIKVHRDPFEDLTFPVMPRLPGVAQKAWSDPHVSTCEDHAVSLGVHRPLWSRDGFTAWLRLSMIDWRAGLRLSFTRDCRPQGGGDDTREG
jgi:hypothetical protein